MAKKKKAKTTKKVVKKSPSSKKTAKKAAKKIVKKKASTADKAKKTKKLEIKENAKDVKPAKKKRKKRVTKAETLRNMQQEQLVKKWHSLVKKIDEIETANYNMRESFEPETAIKHKKMGWGFVLSNVNDRLEVLFEDGLKNLISNYKSR